MELTKWPKIIPPLNPEQQMINDDFMRHWHEVLSTSVRYSLIEKFNHEYAIKHSPKHFLHTLEIGAGLGEHLKYEKLNAKQRQHYVCLELRQNMSDQIKRRHPDVQIQVGNCQETLPYADNHFDRILAIHVLEHLPNLPSALQEMYRLCHKKNGVFSVVIPCEGGFAYSFARRISAQQVFERRYKQSYKWLIEREHINQPKEIIWEIKKYFDIHHTAYFPLILPIIHLNLCIGLTLRPRGDLSHD